MLAIDTNVIVRIVTNDHATQSPRARHFIDTNDVFVSTTVLLETEWVLRSVYAYPVGRIVTALRAFAGLPHVTLEDPALAATALEWTENGMDFADALHLSKASRCEAMMSFDQRLAKAARRVECVPVMAP